MKKLLWILFGIFTFALLLIVIYRMGRDIASVIPQWLTESIVGFCAFVLIGILVVIFAMGISKLKDMLKEG